MLAVTAVLCLLAGSAFGFLLGNITPGTDENLSNKIIYSLKKTWIFLSLSLLAIIFYAGIISLGA